MATKPYTPLLLLCIYKVRLQSLHHPTTQFHLDLYSSINTSSSYKIVGADSAPFHSIHTILHYVILFISKVC